ncbi:MAG: ribosome silencing factor, partial [Pseudomonadales bacterium]
ARQVKALADNVLAKAKEQGVNIIGTEGTDSHEWVLIDLADVLVHVMQPKVRDFYELERLWGMTPANTHHPHA